MGETIGRTRLEFNGSIRIEDREERLSSNAGALLMREYAHRTGIDSWLTEHLDDPRRQDLVTHPFSELLLTSLLLRAQGCEDQDDADRLRNDAALRLSVSTRKGDASLREAPPHPQGPTRKQRVPEGLPSQPTLSRLVFELGTEENRRVLREGLLEQTTRRFERVAGYRPSHLTIDVDDLPIYVEGEQIGAGYHPYYGAKIYRPLVVSLAETGDLLDVVLRNGTAHSTDRFDQILPDLLQRIEERLCGSVSIRIDAGFQGEKTYSTLEARKTKYLGRLRQSAVLDRMAEPKLVRPRGRPPKEPRTWLHEFEYKPEKWSRARRAVLVVLERPGQLWLDHFWLVTNWSAEEVPAAELLGLYRRRGAAEGTMGEWVHSLSPRLSSAVRIKASYRGQPVKKSEGMGYPFDQNEVTLLLSALAYNLMHGVRTLVERRTREGWSLRRLRERALLVASRFLLHARRVQLVIGSGAGAIWEGILAELATIRPAGEEGSVFRAAAKAGAVC